MAIGSNLLGTLGGEALVVLAVVLLLWIVYKIGKSLLKIIIGIIINSVLGIGVVLLCTTFLGLAIPLAIYTYIPLALFGLPAAGTLIILSFWGALG